MVYIENKEKNKVLKLQIGFDFGWFGKTEDKLIEENFVEDNPKQLWKKAKPDGDTESYFFLGGSEDAEKVLTAANASALEIRGM